jgi:hypothetical protein
MPFNPYMAASGTAGIANSLGLFGGGQDPYKDASNQYKKYADQAASYQQPFYNAGTAAIPQYQSWLSSMSDPSAYINNLMGGYSQSPWSQYEQQQAMNAANNMGSASGLTGSTPLQLQAQQNASNISSQDMQKWLNNVLGINQMYGQGQQYLIGSGQQSANSLSKIYEELARQMGMSAYGQAAFQNQNASNMIGGLADIGLSFL